MKNEGEAKLVRIFVGSSDKINNVPLYEEIVFAAKRSGLAGATVLKGVMGFGANSIIHSAKILAISEDLPVVIEIVDDAEKIDQFLPEVENFFNNSKYGVLITTEKVMVIRYAAKKHII
jgi:hypothetical protein